MEEQNLTPQESLHIIDKAISNFKVNYRESAQIFLLWGWMLALASFSNFIILRVLNNMGLFDQMGMYSLANWGVFILIGFVIHFFVMRKIDKNKKVYSHLDTYINKLWQVTAASFFIATILCIKLEISPPPIMLLIAGIAATTSGLLIKFRPVVIGGMAFFLFSIAAAFVSNEYNALITCAAIICGYVVPGYYLKSAKE
jgi:hypothetical protein